MDQFNDVLKKADVKFKFTPEEFAIDEGDFSEFLDEGGIKLVNAFKKAGFDAIVFPDITGNKKFNTTLIFNK